MRVLITGGAGFVGSNLADRLLARGDQVTVIDNFETARRDNLTSNRTLVLIEGTIADPELVNQAFDEHRPEVVVHAAASYKDPDNWYGDAMTNVVGTVNVVRASERLRVDRLIYLQTALGYGLHPVEQPITLNHPLNPGGSSYAISKTAGEEYIFLSSLDYISFRLANAYGPRNLSGPLPTFYHRLTNNKSVFVMDTRRDFIYVDDLVDVISLAVEGRGHRGSYHVSSGRDFSIKELFDATVKALGIKLDKEVEVRPRNPDDVATILLDPSKTEEDFDWQITTPLDVGVAATIDYYKTHGIEQTYTHLKAVGEKA
ncbi:MAG TPA: NAD-dependent epimerase/dehydratase family protein [Candidatus Dormibacteraeota bacterium]